MEELFENWQALPSLADADAAELAETCRAVLDMKNLKENLFKTLEQDKRQIYVLAGEDNRLVASINYEEDIFKSSIEQLPQNLQIDKTIISTDFCVKSNL